MTEEESIIELITTQKELIDLQSEEISRLRREISCIFRDKEDAKSDLEQLKHKYHRFVLDVCRGSGIIRLPEFRKIGEHEAAQKVLRELRARRGLKT